MQKKSNQKRKNNNNNNLILHKNILRTTIFARSVAVLVLSAIIYAAPSLSYSQSQTNNGSSQIAVFSAGTLWVLLQ